MSESSPVHEIPEEDCWAMLHAEEFGRLAFHLLDEVHITPLNYAVDAHRKIIFRTAEGSKLLGLTINDDVAFEIDTFCEHEARSVMLVEELCARLRTPADCRDLALLVARHHGDIRRGPEMSAATVTKLLENADALRRPHRFRQLLDACACDFHGRLGWEEKPIPSPELFLIALDAIRAIDAAAIARSCKDATQIPQRLHDARVVAVKKALALPD